MAAISWVSVAGLYGYWFQQWMDKKTKTLRIVVNVVPTEKLPLWYKLFYAVIYGSALLIALDLAREAFR